jgi:hypothetical protein
MPSQALGGPQSVASLETALGSSQGSFAPPARYAFSPMGFSYIWGG